MNEYPKKFSKYKANLGESPIFDDRTDTLLWVDISSKKILFKNLDDNVESYIDCPDIVSSIQLTNRTDELIGTFRHGFWRISKSGSNFYPIAEVECEMQNNRFNDGRCDAKGRYWAGTMNLDLVSPTGSLYLLYLDGRIKRVLQGLTISNGIVWSTDKTAMFLIDTPTMKVFRFDFDESTQELTNRTVHIDFQKEVGRPDGMTMDSEGMLWIAHARGGRVSRWNSTTGKKLSEFLLPVKGVTSLTFGDRGLDRLYVTTAYEAFQEEEAGYVYVLDPSVKGLPENISGLNVID